MGKDPARSVQEVSVYYMPPSAQPNVLVASLKEAVRHVRRYPIEPTDAEIEFHLHLTDGGDQIVSGSRLKALLGK